MPHFVWIFRIENALERTGSGSGLHVDAQQEVDHIWTTLCGLYFGNALPYDCGTWNPWLYPFSEFRIPHHLTDIKTTHSILHSIFFRKSILSYSYYSAFCRHFWHLSPSMYFNWFHPFKELQIQHVQEKTGIIQNFWKVHSFGNIPGLSENVDNTLARTGTGSGLKVDTQQEAVYIMTRLCVLYLDNTLSYDYSTWYPWCSSLSESRWTIWCHDWHHNLLTAFLIVFSSGNAFSS